MRMIAVVRPATKSTQEQACTRLREVFSKHSLIECDDAIERRDVIEQLIHDMTPLDHAGFQRTVRTVSKHPVHDTVASINHLRGDHIVIRLRNPRLNRLMPYGEKLLEDAVGIKPAAAEDGLVLVDCEVRERGHHEGFLFGTWRAGEPNFVRFMYAEKRRAFNVCVTLLFVLGLILEVGLTLMDLPGRLPELGLRLGAPMLVSSSVLMLERWAYWLKDREPRLRWTPVPTYEPSSPSQADQIF